MCLYDVMTTYYPKNVDFSLILRSQSWSGVNGQFFFTFFFLGSIVKAFKVCLVVSNRKLMIMLAINGANSHLLWFSACIDSYWHDDWASGRDVRSAESLQHFLQWWQCWACGHPVLWMEEAHCSGVFTFYPFLHSLLCISTNKYVWHINHSYTYLLSPFLDWSVSKS